MPIERRRSLRLKCSVLVELLTSDRHWVGTCEDISEGGFRCSSHALPCDTFRADDVVSFLAILPVGRVQGTALVVRVSPHSIALTFQDLEPMIRDRVLGYVRGTAAGY